MADLRGHPWLLSLGLHLLLGTLAAVLVVRGLSPVPPTVHMRLVGPVTGRSPGLPTASNASWWTAPGPKEARTSPPAPDWQGVPGQVLPDPGKVPVPVSLDELVGSQAPVPDAPQDRSAAGWTSPGGPGYVPPPLPPPESTPPEGAGWSLTFTVPGAGGYALSVDGLDSGHPALDRWLGTYLRTVSFPPGLDGQDYQLHWTLNLNPGKPR